MKRKKEHAVLLHILFVILVVTGISIMYNNPHYGEGVSWLTNETYEDTPEFIRQFKTDIDDIFNYIKYKEVFESNGKLAYDKPVVRVTTGPGEVQEYIDKFSPVSYHRRKFDLGFWGIYFHASRFVGY